MLIPSQHVGNDSDTSNSAQAVDGKKLVSSDAQPSERSHCDGPTHSAPAFASGIPLLPVTILNPFGNALALPVSQI
jgi:hypothetical protein